MHLKWLQKKNGLLVNVFKFNFGDHFSSGNLYFLKKGPNYCPNVHGAGILAGECTFYMVQVYRPEYVHGVGIQAGI
jgi:hypothetical protein